MCQSLIADKATQYYSKLLALKTKCQALWQNRVIKPAAVLSLCDRVVRVGVSLLSSGRAITSIFCRDFATPSTFPDLVRDRLLKVTAQCPAKGFPFYPSRRLISIQELIFINGCCSCVRDRSGKPAAMRYEWRGLAKKSPTATMHRGRHA